MAQMSQVIKRKNKLQRRETYSGIMFISPMLIGLLILTVIPTLASLLISFTDWNFVTKLDHMKFAGVKNYSHLFEDDYFMKSVRNNLVLILVVPVELIVSLLLAVTINKHVYFKSFFKVVFFMPYISSIVAVAVVFQVLFHPSLGPVNQTLIALGVTNPPKWLADLTFALPSVMMIMVWVHIGFALIVYLAALQAIPKDLYEAAEIDGAGNFGKFTNITLPMVSSTTFFLLITGVIASFKVFDIIAVLTQGGPSFSTSVIVYYLYKTAFEDLKTGYASAMAWFLFACVMVITTIQWYGQKKWVNY
jgi:multiple sugar transport system permease protein